MMSHTRVLANIGLAVAFGLAVGSSCQAGHKRSSRAYLVVEEPTRYVVAEPVREVVREVAPVREYVIEREVPASRVVEYRTVVREAAPEADPVRAFRTEDGISYDPSRGFSVEAPSKQPTPQAKAAPQAEARETEPTVVRERVVYVTREAAPAVREVYVEREAPVAVRSVVVRRHCGWLHR